MKNHKWKPKKRQANLTEEEYDDPVFQKSWDRHFFLIFVTILYWKFVFSNRTWSKILIGYCIWVERIHTCLFKSILNCGRCHSYVQNVEKYHRAKSSLFNVVIVNFFHKQKISLVPRLLRPTAGVNWTKQLSDCINPLAVSPIQSHSIIRGCIGATIKKLILKQSKKLIFFSLIHNWVNWMELGHIYVERTANLWF